MTDTDIDLTGALVVGTDGSDPSLNAVRWAAAEAHRRNAPLHIVHAREAYVMPGTAPSDVDTLLRLVDEQSASVLERAKAVAEEGLPPASITLSQADGNPARHLIEASGQARLVVVGTSGAGRLRSAIFGSTPLQLAIHATCPVAIIAPVHKHHGPGQPHVVAGIDSSVTSYSAMELALRIAEPDGKVTATHAITIGQFDDVPSVISRYAPGIGNTPDNAQPEPAPLLDERIHDLIAQHPGVTIDTVRASGDAADVLINIARRADMLAISTRGQGGFTGLLLGSVAQRLMQLSPVPLLLVQVGHYEV